MKQNIDKSSSIITIGIIIGIFNGIVVNIDKSFYFNTVEILPILGVVVYSVITGYIYRVFDDILISILYFVEFYVHILIISVIPMVFVGLGLHFLNKIIGII